MAIKIKQIPKDLDFKGKKVLVRVDLNVPIIKDNKGNFLVGDDTKIKYALKTIAYLSNANARVVLCTHLGQPAGKKTENFSLKPVAEVLKHLLPTSVPEFEFVTGWDFKLLQAKVNSLSEGGIILLENLRFNSGEEINDLNFSKDLASLGDIYINEAFAVSHRQHASLVGVTKYLPSYAGWHLIEEVEILDQVRSKPKSPFVVVVGGLKVHDKIGMLSFLSGKANVALIGGAAGNTLLKLNGQAIGKSPIDPKAPTATLRRFLKIKKRWPKIGLQSLIQLPIDVVVAKNINATPRLVDFSTGDKVKPNECIYDIGPKTVQLFSSYIKKAETIVWNGPMGVIEKPQFSQGSRSLGWLIAARSSGRAFGVVGGGETLSVLDVIQMFEYVDYCASGGGAMLAFLSGIELPGLRSIIE